MKYAAGGEPARNQAGSQLEKLCLDFIREDCQELNYSESQNLAKGNVPFCYEQDTNRLCLERAIHRFMQSGTKEDAFDIYYCYCEIFAPFGRGYEATRILLETLSEHEGNSSSLLMSHRDHYSHSVYVFLLGIAVYKGNQQIREAYNRRFGFQEDCAKACCRFLKDWGLTALFHDIGYPFEIAHQQVKTFAYHLAGKEIGKKDTPGECPPPFVSYGKMDLFTKVIEANRYLDLNDIFARELEKRFGRKLQISYSQFYEILEKRASHSVLYMDHAFFSALLILKRLLSVKDEEGQYPRLDFASKEPVKELDPIIAILLHNSLFRFEFGVIGAYKTGDLSKRMSLKEEQPLSYLLMLCDELQCWDRTAYGQNTRQQISPFGFDLENVDGEIRAVYLYDEQYKKKAERSGAYLKMNPNAAGKTKFVEDIAEFVCLDDIGGLHVETKFVKKEKVLKQYVSESNYLNLYDFALSLNGRYIGKIDFKSIDELEGEKLEEVQTLLEKEFEKLTLEYKLSNLAQAKEFASHLDKIGCFYSSRAMDYEVIEDFTEEEKHQIAVLEHERWMNEKLDMGWTYGTDYTNKEERERKRIHRDIVPFEELDYEAVRKDFEPMRLLIKLLNLYDGLRIYRLSK